MIILRINLYDPETEKYRLCFLHIEQGLIKTIRDTNDIDHDLSFIDLTDLYAYPSFIDAHCHLINLGKQLHDPPLDKIVEIDELTETIRYCDDEIVYLRGWKPFAAPFLLNRSLLDRIDPKRAVLLMGKCGHVGYINSKAIQLFGLLPYDGMDGSDLSAGFLRERLLDVARSFISFSPEQLKKYLSLASSHCIKYGITSVHSDDWNAATAKHLIQILSNQYSLRIYEHLNLSPPFSISWAKKNLSVLTHSSDFFSLSSFKWILDGSLGGRSAFLSSPYHDAPNERGVLYYTLPELADILEKSEELGFTSVMHVIGDEALTIALNAFSRSVSLNNSLQHRLLHLQMASENQINEMVRRNIFVSIQPVFFDADQEMALSRLGPARMSKLSYPFAQMENAGVSMSISTDAPIESINPFKNIVSAERFMTRKKAFQAYTIAASKSAFQQKKLGRIQKEGFADLFFLEEDLFSIPSQQLPFIQPVFTMFHGSWTNSPPPPPISQTVGVR